MPDQDRPHLQPFRDKLGAARGREFWRTLDELADTPEFREAIEREFPVGAAEWATGTSRRRFLQLMGASLALSGLSGCFRQPEEKIIPYVRQPAELVPGKPLFYASTIPHDGVGTGVLVESHLGRPTKIEGNAEHPASLGATDAYTQAAILDFYDPDRSQTVLQYGEISTWDLFLTRLRVALGEQEVKRGTGLRILTESITSPTTVRLMRQVLTRFPDAQWHQYQPINRDSARAGATAAFGRDVEPIYHLDAADVILSLDADMLGSGRGHVRYARDFSNRRTPGESMSRLYVAETMPSPTGSAADHRWPLSPSLVEALARAVSQRVAGSAGADDAALTQHVPSAWIDALASDLRSAGSRALVVPGACQPPVVHQLAHSINQTLGSVGTTVTFIEPIEAEPVDQAESLRTLVEDMRGGRVELLIVLGGNPVFTAPADLDFVGAMENVERRVHMSLSFDETSKQCEWHLPEAHWLESWGDLRAFDGTTSLIQPLIAPLYDGRSQNALLAALNDEASRTDHELVQETWQTTLGQTGFADAWATALHDGLWKDSASPTVDVQATGATVEPAATTTTGGLDIALRPHPTVFDGRYANNGWLQELPQPLTKLTWDNALMVSPATAKRLKLSDHQVVELVTPASSKTKLRVPVLVLPGHAADCATLHVGLGRQTVGRVGKGVGVDAYPLRSDASPWLARGVKLTATTETEKLATAQMHFRMEGRDLIKSGTAAEFNEHPEHPSFMQSHEHAEGHEGSLSMFPPVEYTGYKWGMSIDLTKCLGCNACVVACQAENNIPVVGKDQVAMGREMHWLRLDTYYAGDADTPETFHQPVTCMHCENAPCEIVCPVAATVHSNEGLNQMIYNRCVGTRYCANNCPYKVRRFNFLQYSDETTPSLKPMRNPDVTVRSRGVMEKCTYCVQRISVARIDAENQDRSIRDGEVVTACQAACASQAIVFGDLNDKSSQVLALQESPLNFSLLEPLNTRPRTTYLAAIRNPNPAIPVVGDEHG